MQPAHPLERAVGIAHYVSDAAGTGGRLRVDPEDFRVREIELFDTRPVDADRGDYPHLVLRAELRSWDTNDFAGALSDRLGISRERVSWAGTKDKHAVTTQLFSVDGVDPGELPDLSGVEYEPVGRAGRPILFGDLAGNAFEIRIRDADAPANAAAVTEQLRAFAAGSEHDEGVGAPNYFGQQRFGSKKPVTHAVGLAVVRGEWEEAVMAYLGDPSEREPEETQAARAFVEETRDWTAALDEFPGYLGYERAMLHRLAEGEDEPADFRAALEAVPSNLQRLFVNAAQSYVFNRILSTRLERGLPFDRPVAGDVVCFADADAPDGLELPDSDRTPRIGSPRSRATASAAGPSSPRRWWARRRNSARASRARSSGRSSTTSTWPPGCSSYPASSTPAGHGGRSWSGPTSTSRRSRWSCPSRCRAGPTRRSSSGST